MKRRYIFLPLTVFLFSNPALACCFAPEIRPINNFVLLLFFIALAVPYWLSRLHWYIYRRPTLRHRAFKLLLAVLGFSSWAFTLAVWFLLSFASFGNFRFPTPASGWVTAGAIVSVSLISCYYFVPKGKARAFALHGLLPVFVAGWMFVLTSYLPVRRSAEAGPSIAVIKHGSARTNPWDPDWIDEPL